MKNIQEKINSHNRIRIGVIIGLLTLTFTYSYISGDRRYSSFDEYTIISLYHAANINGNLPITEESNINKIKRLLNFQQNNVSFNSNYEYTSTNLFWKIYNK
jgi:hypothetical protein